MSANTVRLTVGEARWICTEACLACGASEATARSLVDATVSAACFGRPALGFPHLSAYLDSLAAGRIDGRAEPVVTHPLPAFVHVDARRGIAQLGFDAAFEALVSRASEFGVAVLSQKNSYTTGELGYYVRRLAARGLAALAVCNGPALMAASPGTGRVYCTNPLAFAMPLPPPLPPLLVDQSASATAFVNIVRAAAEGRSVPEGWALDADGEPTVDAAAAIAGALLPFGGYKGANIALIVEMLAAGFSGAAWSLDGGDFRSGDRSPDAGLTIIAMSPAAAGPGLAERAAEQIRRLQAMGVHVPGMRAKAAALWESDEIEVEAAALSAIRDHSGRRPA